MSQESNHENVIKTTTKYEAFQNKDGTNVIYIKSVTALTGDYFNILKDIYKEGYIDSRGNAVKITMCQELSGLGLIDYDYDAYHANTYTISDKGKELVRTLYGELS